MPPRGPLPLALGVVLHATCPDPLVFDLLVGQSVLADLATSTTFIVRRLVFGPIPELPVAALLCITPSLSPSSLCLLAAAAAIASSYSGPNPAAAEVATMEVATMARWSAASSSREMIIGALDSVNESSKGSERDSARVIEAYKAKMGVV